MRSVLFGLAGGAVVVALSGDALASPPLANTCYDVGFACLNAGPDGNQPGTCMAATCVDLLDASFACGVCEPADAGASDGGTHGSTTDAGSSEASAADSEAPGVDAAPVDAAAAGDAAAADAEPVEGDSSAGTDEAGGGVLPGSEAGSSSSGDEPDAGPQATPTMPGCAAAPSSRDGSTGFALLALGMAVVARARRRRR
jgi:MYXO-CTERM domain-containing protein